MLPTSHTGSNSRTKRLTHRSEGCQQPDVVGARCPLVFRASRMYMSPRTLSPRAIPSRSYTFIWLEPVTTRNASPGPHRSQSDSTSSAQVFRIHCQTQSGCKLQISLQYGTKPQHTNASHLPLIHATSLQTTPLAALLFD